jgi:protein SFI1
MSLNSSPTPSSSSSYVALSAAGDGDEYSEEELQFIWDTVIRAEATLPQLPPSSRHPTNALFRAYGDLLEERNIEPIDGAKLDKLLFKIGGSRDGNTIAEKFQAVMAKMNITVRLDVDDITDDDFSSHSDISFQNNDRDQYHPSEIAGYLGQTNRGDKVNHIEPSDKPLNKNQDPEDDYAKAELLEKSAVEFEEHRDRMQTLHVLEQWQDKAYLLKNQAELFVEARVEDLILQSRDVLVAWNEIAVEVDEMPLDDLPANVYSKRIERIAMRTHEIKTSKNLLVGWRNRTQERLRQQTEQQRQWDEEHHRQIIEDELFQDDPKLLRLAQRTHEILSKSRTLAQWSNRAAEEEEKAEVAKRAHEMSLKAKAFGLRPKPQIFASLRQRLQEKISTTRPVHETEASRPHQITVERPENRDAEEAAPMEQLNSTQPSGPGVSEQESHIQGHSSDTHRGVDPSQEPKLLPPHNVTAIRDFGVQVEPEPVMSKEVAQTNDESVLADELDERTLLAKRHLMRMRFFRAWEEYTSKHTKLVEEFATNKALESWYVRSCQIKATAQEGTQEHAQRRDRHLLAQWRRPDERQRKLEAMAAAFYRRRRLGNVLAGWRAAAIQAKAKAQESDEMSNLADQYCRTHGTLQAWKARSRETAVKTSMKQDATQIWRNNCAEDQRRRELMEYMAQRVDLYRIKQKVVPSWRGAATGKVERKQQLRTWSQRADFYSLTTQAITTWRATAKAKRRARLRETYLEVRRRVKKAMGARCIAEWHKSSEARRHHLDVVTEEFTKYHDWNAQAQSIMTWRLQAREKAEIGSARYNEAQQQHLKTWRSHNDSLLQLQIETEEHFQDKAISRAVKEWKLGSLQLESRRNASERHLNRQKKQLKQGFELWYAKAADKAQRTPVVAEEESVIQEPEQEEVDFISTPARPRLFMGPLTQTTTPLAPIPQRQPWSGLRGGPGDSILGRPLTAPGGTASRSGRSRRNLRVSWADRG